MGTTTASGGAQPPDVVSKEISLAAIRESRTNPRRTFDKASLAELTESVRAHGVLQPVLVRPSRSAKHPFELVIGARRFRAAKAAKLETIPATVRDLDNVQVLELQVVENLQRDDIHPLEEAEGYRLLHEKHGLAVEELAAKIGKSRAYVYGRLKLCALSKEAREVVLHDDVDASIALLVARIPVPKLQLEALEEVAGDEWEKPMTYRAALEHVQRNFMLQLKAAPFDPKANNLVPGVGPCGECPKRTGNQAELFADVKEKDLCTDPECFGRKRAAHTVRVQMDAEAAGRKVVTGQAAQRMLHGSAHVALDQRCWDDPKQRTWGQLLKKQPLVPTVAILDDVARQVLPKKDAVAALKKAGHRFKVYTGHTASAQDNKRQAANKLRWRVVKASVEDLVQAAEASRDQTMFARLVCEALLRGHAEPLKLTEKRRGWKSSRAGYVGIGKELTRTLDAMAAKELRGLAVELIAMDQASSNWSREGYGEGWRRACELLAVDFRGTERAIKAEDRKKARKPKAKAKKKAPARRRAKTSAKAAAQETPSVTQVGKCRGCGCTEATPCDTPAGACAWADETRTLCTACAPSPSAA